MFSRHECITRRSKYTVNAGTFTGFIIKVRAEVTTNLRCLHWWVSEDLRLSPDSCGQMSVEGTASHCH